MGVLDVIGSFKFFLDQFNDYRNNLPEGQKGSIRDFILIQYPQAFHPDVVDAFVAETLQLVGKDSNPTRDRIAAFVLTEWDLFEFYKKTWDNVALAQKRSKFFDLCDQEKSATTILKKMACYGKKHNVILDDLTADTRIKYQSYRKELSTASKFMIFDLILEYS